MGKIAQETARQISVKVTEPIQKKITETNQEIKSLLTLYYKDTIPADVMKVWKKNPDYVRTVSDVVPKGVGISLKNSERESIEKMPSNTNQYYYTLNLTKEQAAIYVKLFERREDLKLKCKSTQREIEATILTLGTHKRVEEQFPEIVGFFPENSIKQNNQLMVQVAPLREKVRCLLSADVDKKCIDGLNASNPKPVKS